MDNKTAPKITLFVEYKDGRKIRYDTLFKKSKSAVCPYDFYFRIKKDTADNIKVCYLSVEKTGDMPYGIVGWKVPLILQSDTFIVMTVCGNRIMLDIANSLNRQAVSTIIGYRHVPVLDHDGNQLYDKYGPMYVVKPVRVTEGHTIKRVDIDGIHPHVKKLVSFH